MSNPLLHVVIPHRGVDGKTVTEQRRAQFARLIQTNTAAAAALARWPHYTGEWGPTIVTSAFLNIRVMNGSWIGRKTMDVLLEELGRCAYSPLAERHYISDHFYDGDPCRLEIEIEAKMVERVDNPVDLAAKRAKEHVPNQVLTAGEAAGEITRDEIGRIVNASVGVDALYGPFGPQTWWLAEQREIKMPPVDRMDEFLARVNRPEPNPDAITHRTLQREVRIQPKGGSKNKRKGEKITASAAERAARFDQRTKELHLQEHGF